jgi:hypothetical protein
MSLAFFHGEYLMSTLAIAASVAVLVPAAVALWWWQYPPRSPILHAVIYLLVAAVCCGMWRSESDSILVTGLGFALLLPWSLIYFVAGLIFSVEVSVGVMLLGILVNGALVYGGAALAGRQR